MNGMQQLARNRVQTSRAANRSGNNPSVGPQQVSKYMLDVRFATGLKFLDKNGVQRTTTPADYYYGLSLGKVALPLC